MHGFGFTFLPRSWRLPFPLAIFVSAFLVLAPARSEESGPAAIGQPAFVASSALFQRILLIGASVTAGFNSAEPFGGTRTPEYRFANYIEAALRSTHDPVRTAATTFLFLHAPESLEKQVAAALAAKPTLVIALDALFWFCYGGGVTDEERLTRCDSALRQLSRIDAPLVIGDVPDATKAVGGILDK